MKASRSIKIRLYPNKEQLVLIEKSLGCDRWIYNKALALKKQRWDDFKQNVSWLEISKMVTFWKKTEELKWLNEPSRSVFEGSLRKLDTAYNNFFKGRTKFPRFKKKGEYNSFVLSSPSRLIGNGHIKLSKLGIVKIKGLRNFEGKIKNTTISKNPNGELFASFSVEDVEKVIRPISSNKTVGIDVNLENFLTDSNGIRIENPRFKKEVFKKIKFYQKKLSKCIKGSKNRLKWKNKIAVLFQKISNKKSNFLHNLSHSYVKNHDIIMIEKLQIKNMIKNHKLAESITSVSWGEFFRQLKYKGEWYGCKVTEVAPHNTSSICCDCKTKNEGLTLKDRTWTCTNCGSFHIRDENAAKNIKLKGESIILKARGGIDTIQLYEFGNCLQANVMLT